jgi:hypothetical protein
VHQKLPEARILPQIPARDPEGGTGAHEAPFALARERAPGHTALARRERGSSAHSQPERRLAMEATIQL